jgi:hypothetical protein
VTVAIFGDHTSDEGVTVEDVVRYEFQISMECRLSLASLYGTLLATFHYSPSRILLHSVNPISALLTA